MRINRRTVCLYGAASALMTVGRPSILLAADRSGVSKTADIRRILDQRLKDLSAQQDGISITVGLVSPHGLRTVSSADPGEATAGGLNRHLIFEIGSVTKAFSALLLAEMVRTGQVNLTDEAARYLPQGARLPQRNGRQITLVDLATHTSGLPFMPDIKSADGALNRIGPEDLYRFLADYTLSMDIGTSWDYSNLGYWLLGEALAHRADMGFTELLRQRILAPLDLTNTTFELSSNQLRHLAPGHDSSLKLVPPISSVPIYSLMPAAGGLYSSIDDLLKLLAVAMDYRHSLLRKAFAVSLANHRPTQQPGYEQALGWTIIEDGDGSLVFRDGGTFGYASCMVWDPAKRTGVVALSNQPNSVADIAHHLLRPAFPLEHPVASRHVQISLDPTILDRCTGSFDAPGEGVFRITRQEESLVFDAPKDWGLPTLHLHPESATEYFGSELPLRLVCQIDSDLSVRSILITPPRGQHTIAARRISN